MAAINRTPALIDVPTPHNCEIERGVLGAAAEPGMWLYLDGNNGWKPAIGTSAETAKARGMCIADGFGSLSFASGQTVDIVLKGRVSGFSGLTPDGDVHISPDTAGAGDQSAPGSGAYQFIGGYAWDAESILVNPQITDPTLVS